MLLSWKDSFHKPAYLKKEVYTICVSCTHYDEHGYFLEKNMFRYFLR